MMHVLVTGGAKRIGEAISLMVATHGGVPIIHCNTSLDEAMLLERRIHDAGGKAHVVRADLSRPETMDALFDDILSKTGGRLDAIVNNASLYAPTGHGSACRAIHVLSPLALIRRLAAMGGSGKAVVNLLDTRTRDDAHAEYMAAKNELRELTLSLARELAPAVRVCGVAAGAVLQEEGHPVSELERLAAFNPLHAHGTPEGLAECVRLLLETEFMTGEIIHYDGGYHLARS